jgi:hypothetical protein
MFLSSPHIPTRSILNGKILGAFATPALFLIGISFGLNHSCSCSVWRYIVNMPK